MYETTETFSDWDAQLVKIGTLCDEVIERGPVSTKSGKMFWNMIRDGRVIAVTVGKPPVKLITERN